MEIPDNLKELIIDCKMQGGNLLVTLNEEHNNQIVIETISKNFSKFKANMVRSLIDKGVLKADITKVTSMIQNNYREIYPDDGRFEQQINSEDKPKQSERPIITIE